MWKEVVPPSTMWRSMSVRTDIVWTETICTGVREIIYKRYRGTGVALRASPSKRSQFMREHPFTRFRVLRPLRYAYILFFSRSRRSRSRYYNNIILLFAAASLIRIMHRPPASITIIISYYI